MCLVFDFSKDLNILPTPLSFYTQTQQITSLQAARGKHLQHAEATLLKEGGGLCSSAAKLESF